MYLLQHWKMKEVPLYLLEIAIFLALFQRSYIKQHHFQWDGDHRLMFAHHDYFYEEHSVNNIKVQRLLKNLTLESNSTANNEDSYAMDESYFAPLHLRNITVNMVLVSSLRETEDNFTSEHAVFSLAEQNSSRDGFSFENMQALQGWNNSTNISEAQNNINTFSNADDVRWQQYLNVNSTETSRKHCENENCAEKDISKFESFNALASNSFFNEPSTSKDMLDMSELFDNPFESITASDLNIPSTSHSKNTVPDVDDLSLSLNTTGKEDSDLMQILYEQDADLGYNNWQQNEPLKQLKQVDEIQKIKNDILDVNNFFIDGETGEQILIPPNQSPQQQVPVLPQYQNNVNASPVAGNDAINIEECLEILEHSIDDMGQPAACNQNSVVGSNNMVGNASMLIDTNGNRAMQSNADIWQQIDELSEMTGLNLQEVNQPAVQPVQNELNNSFTSYNGQMQTVEARIMNSQVNYSPVTYNGMGQVAGNSPSYGSPVSQSFPISNFPTNAQSPPIQASPSYMSPQLISDDGVPMDTTYSPMGSPERQEPKFQMNNFNNFNYDASPLGEGNPALSSLPEPGQSFFDYLQPENNVASDFAPATSAMTSFSAQTNAPYMNPPVVSYPPPPLNPSTSSASFMDMSSAVEKNAIVHESYESDSGISLDQSPRGLEFLTLTPADETAYNADLSIIKTEPSDHDMGFIPELKAIHHNHTYNGTLGVKKQPKHQEKSSASRESRDEKKARELSLPFSLDEIILSPVEEYNEILARTPLTPAQQTLVKDIRRRGKNKVAAQNCRKRKIETITTMEEDVEVMRNKKQQLVEEQKDLEVKFDNIKLKYSSLYQEIFSSLRDDTGRPYDPSHFRLEQVEGAVLLVPNMGGKGKNMGEEGSSSGAETEYSNLKMEKRH